MYHVPRGFYFDSLLFILLINDLLFIFDSSVDIILFANALKCFQLLKHRMMLSKIIIKFKLIRYLELSKLPSTKPK